MRLSDYLRADLVLPRLRERALEGVLHEISRAVDAAGLGIHDVVADKLLERERIHPTVMGSGLAIPHATIPGLTGPIVGIALADEPVEFGPPDSEPVRLFFVLLSPPGFEREHVKILARICRLVRHPDFIDRLAAAGDSQGMVRVVEAVDALHV
ncbi:MAG: PTS sugar transporter subunit IIA [Phycisphaerales bacterium]|nr:PTS sugar transporter subunit IIA [Phycisphaerales bacterium]